MIKEESIKILKGTFGLFLISLAVSSLIFGFKFEIFTGLFFGTIYCNINFFMIAQASIAALNREASKASIYMSFNYIVRYIITGCIIYYVIKLDVINTLAFCVTLFFPKAIIIINAARKKGG